MTSESELLRAECNRLAAQRDQLKKRCDSLAREVRDLTEQRNAAILSAKNLSDFNQQCLDTIARATKSERERDRLLYEGATS